MGRTRIPSIGRRKLFVGLESALYVIILLVVQSVILIPLLFAMAAASAIGGGTGGQRLIMALFRKILPGQTAPAIARRRTPHPRPRQKRLDRAHAREKGLLVRAKFWSEKLMDWAMRDEALKVQLFRFVDVFPMLKTPAGSP